MKQIVDNDWFKSKITCDQCDNWSFMSTGFSGELVSPNWWASIGEIDLCPWCYYKKKLSGET